MSTIIEMQNVSVDFSIREPRIIGSRASAFRAVDNVSLKVSRGETLGLVGESGSGKTTLGRTLIRRLTPTSGSIAFNGADIAATQGRSLRLLRRDLQMVFQDASGSLDPRMRVHDLIAEPMIVHKMASNDAARRARVLELLDLTGLSADFASRYPHALSGGQRQRVAIARALSVEPQFMVLDEPVAALDTSVQAQVVNLLLSVQRKLDLSYLFVSHDIAVVGHMADRIAVMYAGKIVEQGSRNQVLKSPAHPYTTALLSAVPGRTDRQGDRQERIVLTGDGPDQTHASRGCRFASRCPVRRETLCDETEPELREISAGHTVACHWVDDPIRIGQARAVLPTPGAGRQSSI